MELKLRLQRVLQILGDAECAGALSDLERDIILAELREAYSEVKFGVVSVEPKGEQEVVAPVVPQPEPQSEPQSEPELDDEQEDEPEVEFEIIYNEEDDEDDEAVAEVAESEPIAESNEVEPSVEEVEPVAVEEPAEESAEESAKEPAEMEIPILPKQPTKRSPILSLYEDSVPVIGEQFREKPSVADAISCPKGVAESAPVTSLREAIGVADKFMLIRELFGGDNDAYETAIDQLEQQPSFDDCVIYIAENYTWRAQSEGTKFMMELLQRKYNA